MLEVALAMQGHVADSAGGAFGAITIGVLDANALRALFLLLPIIYAPLWLCNNINSFKFTLIQ